MMNIFYGILGVSWMLLVLGYVFYRIVKAVDSKTNVSEEL